MSNVACHHGMVQGRGCAHLELGNFGRLFPDLEPLFSHTSLLEALGRPGGIMDSNRTANSNIPAGYTFFAQFVDHDVTLDTQSRLESDQVQNPEKIANFRSASLDLDCVYGFGPEASPHLYDSRHEGMLIAGTDENPDDLARAKDGTALIGDPRNDENIFVNQMQRVFINLHNRLIEAGLDFESAQEECRFHYQYVVVHDFLRQVCDPAIYKFAIDKLYRRDYPLCYGPDKHGKLPMPVEFSVAAYRFGHSMVRSNYTIRRKSGNSYRNRSIELFSDEFLTNGFTPIPAELKVDWSHLLSVNGSTPNMSKAIDGTLATELNDLPFMRAGEPNPNKRSLAFRNLLRGRSLGLPSGQAVAQALADCGYDVTPEEINLRGRQGRAASGLSAKEKRTLATETPLFFYCLAEGGDNNSLGPTASAILMEVFGGMLVNCDNTYLAHPEWQPDPDIASTDHELTLADLVAYANKL